MIFSSSQPQLYSQWIQAGLEDQPIDRADALKILQGDSLDLMSLLHAAGTVRLAIRDRFACPGPFGTQWAYETDGRGRHRRYHDANDLPTALAPLWGLCPPEDRQWSATMRFALDPANPGWSPGRWGGLGSAHTPGSWPLGDVQEWVVASLLGETGRAGRVLERLLAVAAPDGLLPETYDSDTGTWLARHWFAWPGAVLAALALGALPASAT